VWTGLAGQARLGRLAGWRALVNLVNSQDLTHAAAIAYYALLSLFPFLLLVVSVLGAVAADEVDRAAVLGFVFRYIPTQLDFVTTQLDSLQESQLRIGLVGGVGLVWASLGVFSAVTTAVNQAWGVERQRSFWKHRLISFTMLLSAGGALLMGLLLVGMLHVGQGGWLGTVIDQLRALYPILVLPLRYLATVLLIAGTGLIFYFLPNTPVRFRDVWFGAVLTGVVWRLAFEGFSWYMQVNSQLTRVHGSIAAVVVFLLWVYISAVVLLYGVEFTAAWARLRGDAPPLGGGGPRT